MIKKFDYQGIISGFVHKTVCVLGDFIADRFIYGKPYKLSREAPVVVVRYDGEKLVPGGAGNCVCNLLALGCKVIPIGVLGDDDEGREIIAFFKGKGVDVSHLHSKKQSHSICKTRIFAGDRHTSKQQVIRIDKEPETSFYNGARERIVKNAISDISAHSDAIIVSDYGYGLFDGTTIDSLRNLSHYKPVVVDSRYDLPRFSGMTAITPNESELLALVGDGCSDEDGKLFELAEMQREKLNLEVILFTRGNKGMVVLERDKTPFVIPIFGSDDVTDVTGAGDTVISAFTLSLASGAPPRDAAVISNAAAGVVVMKRGTAVCNVTELLRQLDASLG